MKIFNYLSIALAMFYFTACGGDSESTTEEETTTSEETTEATDDTVASEEMTMEMPDSATAMKKWMEAMAPGEMHEMMAGGVGEWNAEVTMWMDPQSEPTTSPGTQTTELILGGRYSKSTFKGSMGDMPFEGVSTTGFNKTTGEFEMTWIDNMGTGMMMLKGPYNKETHSVELKGEIVDPIMETKVGVRETFNYVDENTREMNMYMNMGGTEFKTLQIKYTRK